VATDDDATVRRLLAAIGIEPPADEVDEMIKSYPALRAAGRFVVLVRGGALRARVFVHRRELRGDMSTDVPFTIADAAVALRSGAMTSVELTTMLLRARRRARLDPRDLRRPLRRDLRSPRRRRLTRTLPRVSIAVHCRASPSE
jgi:hypothetical protein